MSGKNVDYQRIYKAVPLFRDLSEEEVDELMQASRLFRAGKDTILVKEGMVGTGLYILVNGSAEVKVTSRLSGAAMAPRRSPWLCDHPLME